MSPRATEARARIPVDVAIDPGVSGGIAWMDRQGRFHAAKMPEGMTAQADFIRKLLAEEAQHHPPHVVMEKTGLHVQGNSASSSAKFARHCGHLEMALYCFGARVVQVAPAKWMRALGALPKDKKERKAAIKEEMARRHPHLTVTLSTADALGILEWAKQAL